MKHRNIVSVILVAGFRGVPTGRRSLGVHNRLSHSKPQSFRQGCVESRLTFSGNIKGTSVDFHGLLTKFSILKRGKSFSSFQPANMQREPGNHMKDLKNRDVQRLLTVIGVDERHEAYSFYAQSFGPNPNDDHSCSENSLADFVDRRS